MTTSIKMGEETKDRLEKLQAEIKPSLAELLFVETHDIDHLLSFDDDFDGLAPRLDPAGT